MSVKNLQKKQNLLEADINAHAVSLICFIYYISPERLNYYIKSTITFVLTACFQ